MTHTTTITDADGHLTMEETNAIEAVTVMHDREVIRWARLRDEMFREGYDRLAMTTEETLEHNRRIAELRNAWAKIEAYDDVLRLLRGEE